MSIKIGDIYYIDELGSLCLLKKISTQPIRYPYRFIFLHANNDIETDYPCAKIELDNKVILNNPINKLLYPEYVEKGDLLYEKDIDANFTLDDYYKLRNSYNERSS